MNANEVIARLATTQPQQRLHFQQSQLPIRNRR
jgi:hypothetical protein